MIETFRNFRGQLQITALQSIRLFFAVGFDVQIFFLGIAGFYFFDEFLCAEFLCFILQQHPRQFPQRIPHAENRIASDAILGFINSAVGFGFFEIRKIFSEFLNVAVVVFFEIRSLLLFESDLVEQGVVQNAVEILIEEFEC